MRYKLIAMCVLIAGGAASLFVYEVRRAPVWSIASAEAGQRQLNSMRRTDDCGRWMVTRYPDSEGRVFYDIDHCSVPAEMQAEIWSKNRQIDRSQTMAEIDQNIELLLENLAVIRIHNRAREQTRGVDAAVNRIYRGLVR
jgi:hypothetical protein